MRLSYDPPKASVAPVHKSTRSKPYAGAGGNEWEDELSPAISKGCVSFRKPADRGLDCRNVCKNYTVTSALTASLGGNGTSDGGIRAKGVCRPNAGCRLLPQLPPSRHEYRSLRFQRAYVSALGTRLIACHCRQPGRPRVPFALFLGATRYREYGFRRRRNSKCGMR